MWYSICNMTKFVYEIESRRGSESNKNIQYQLNLL